MALPVSKPQLDLLNAFQDFARAQGRTPSVRELAKQLRRAPSTIHQMLRALEQKGLMKNAGAHHGWQAKAPRSGMATVRVRGIIAAGAPIEAIETDDDVVLFPADQVDAETFALRVRGDSMIDDHICDGDIVLVHRQSKVDDGDIAVALLDDGTATLKRVYRDAKRRKVRLQPANAALAPIFVDRVKIQGKAVGVVRSFGAKR